METNKPNMFRQLQPPTNNLGNALNFENYRNNRFSPKKRPDQKLTLSPSEKRLASLACFSAPMYSDAYGDCKYCL